MLRWLYGCAVCISLLLFSSHPLCASDPSPKKIYFVYDSQIKTAATLYWGGLHDWRFLWAQLFQESRFNPKAVSPVGAQGLAQFMPGTWKDMQRIMGIPSEISAYNEEASISAAALYMVKLRKSWAGRPRPEMDRWDLARASYNGGVGNILKAQRLCGDAALYNEIIICLPKVTGDRNSAETIGYNAYIHRYYKMRLLWEYSGLL